MTKLTRRAFLKMAGVGTAADALYEIGPRASLLRALDLEEQATAQAHQEVWRSTICQQCQAGCGLLVRVVDGRAAKIEGNPLHPSNKGKICPKAQAGLQVLYDPDRICAACHGDQGQGTAIAKEPLNSPEFLKSRSDDDLRQATADGIPDTAMPSYSDKLSTVDIADIIAFFRSWQ